MFSAGLHKTFRQVLLGFSIGFIVVFSTNSVASAADLTFQPAQSAVTGSSPLALNLTDFNGDKQLDAVTASQDNGAVSTLLGQPNQIFPLNRVTKVNAGPCQILSEDVNKDGNIDIVSLNRDPSTNARTISILSGDGQGNFALIGQIPLTGTASSKCGDFALADMNHDSWLDILVGDSVADPMDPLAQRANTVNIFHGSAAGFSNPVKVPLPSAPEYLRATDVDRDGKKDIVVFSGKTMSTYLGSQAGFVASASFPAVRMIGLKDSFSDAAIGDLNNDTLPDTVALASSRQVIVSQQVPKNGFASPQNFALQSDPNALELKDINQDGFLDIITANAGSSSVSVLVNNNGNGFLAEQNFPVPDSPADIAVGDINNDGAMDIVTTSQIASSVAVLLGVKKTSASQVVTNSQSNQANVTSAVSDATSSVTNSVTSSVTSGQKIPRCIVPELRGLSLANAKQKLLANGCVLGKLSQQKATRKKVRLLKKKGFRLVVSTQSIAAKQELAANTKINLRLQWKKVSLKKK